MLLFFCGRVWARHALLFPFLWDIPYWHGFPPPRFVSLEWFSVFWDVPKVSKGLLAQF